MMSRELDELFDCYSLDMGYYCSFTDKNRKEFIKEILTLIKWAEIAARINELESEYFYDVCTANEDMKVQIDGRIEELQNQLRGIEDEKV